MRSGIYEQLILSLRDYIGSYSGKLFSTCHPGLSSLFLSQMQFGTIIKNRHSGRCCCTSGRAPPSGRRRAPAPGTSPRRPRAPPSTRAASCRPRSGRSARARRAGRAARPRRPPPNAPVPARPHPTARRRASTPHPPLLVGSHPDELAVDHHGGHRVAAEAVRQVLRGPSSRSDVGPLADARASPAGPDQPSTHAALSVGREQRLGARSSRSAGRPGRRPRASRDGRGAGIEVGGQHADGARVGQGAGRAAACSPFMSSAPGSSTAAHSLRARAARRRRGAGSERWSTERAPSSSGHRHAARGRRTARRARAAAGRAPVRQPAPRAAGRSVPKAIGLHEHVEGVDRSQPRAGPAAPPRPVEPRLGGRPLGHGVRAAGPSAHRLHDLGRPAPARAAPRAPRSRERP